MNPNGRHFNRDAVSDGSYVFEDPLEFGNSFKNFDTLIKKVKSNQIIEKRQEIIKDAIGHSDGNNFKRASHEILKILNADYPNYKNKDVGIH